MFSSETNEWSTPQYLFEQLNNEFNFTLDPCATDENKKCENHFTKEDDGLSRSWKDETVFCNPPYGRQIGKWVKKAYEETKDENTKVVMLIPSRTDTKYFHDYIYEICEVRFLKGRVYFEKGGKKVGRAPFPSMVVVFN